VNYVHDYLFDEWIDGGYYNSYEEWATYVYATSADFHFEGPDADLLNQIVDQPFVQGSVMDGVADTAFLKLWYGSAFDARDPFGAVDFPAWNMAVILAEKVWLECYDYGGPGSIRNEQGFPVLVPQLLMAEQSVIHDYRTGSSSSLSSQDDIVNI